MTSRLPAFPALRLFSLALVITLLSACAEEAPPPPKEVVRPVKLITIAEDGSSTSREFPGTVTATQSVELGFEVAGKIVELPISDGKSVKKVICSPVWMLLTSSPREIALKQIARLHSPLTHAPNEFLIRVPARRRR